LRAASAPLHICARKYSSEYLSGTNILRLRQLCRAWCAPSDSFPAQRISASCCACGASAASSCACARALNQAGLLSEFLERRRYHGYRHLAATNPLPLALSVLRPRERERGLKVSFKERSLRQAAKKCALARTVHFLVYFDPIISYFHNPKPSHLCQTNP